MAGLEDLYREIILDHYRAPRNRGELPVPPAQRVEGFNPLCGDEVILYLEVADDGTVVDVRTEGQGCSISQASTSMMSAAIKGKPVEEVRRLIRAFKALMSIHESKLEGADDAEPGSELEGVRLGDLEALQGVVKFPVRIKCATLAWNTLQQALDEAAAAERGTGRLIRDTPLSELTSERNTGPVRWTAVQGFSDLRSGRGSTIGTIGTMDRSSGRTWTSRH